MRVVRLFLPILFAAALTGSATAQLRSNRPNRPTQNLPRLMTANPYAANSADSAAAVRVGEGMRKRMEDVAGKWFTIITRDQMNEALLQYAYPADAVLPPTVARTLATQLQARFIITSTLSRTEGGRYSVQVRAIGMNDRAGYTASLTQAPNTSPEDFGKTAADALSANFKALEDAKKCWDTQVTKPADAIASAGKALKDQPNHGLAEYCLAEIASTRKAPRDTLIAHYKNATVGDPLSLEAWSKLKDEYVAANDTGNVIKTYQEMLRVAPTNQQLRDQAFRVFLQYGQPQAARQVAEEGLAMDASNAELWDLKSNACLFLEDFTCAVDALEQAFAVDSARADSMFYNKISVAATQRPDTARLLKWAQRGAKKYPNSATMLDHLVTAYSYAGPVDSSITSVKRLYAVDSSDMRPALKVIQQLAAEKRWTEVEDLGQYVERLGDAEMKQNYALLLVNGALAKLQQPDSQDLEGSAAMARKAVGLSVPGGRVALNANYILGLATVLQLPKLDQPIMDAKSCEMAQKSQALRDEAENAITIGAPAIQDTNAVQRYLQIAQGFKPRIESQVKAFCK
jgi:tetratricopeptide (TPR) repeat protein